jgi:hypothetical protein
LASRQRANKVEKMIVAGTPMTATNSIRRMLCQNSASAKAAW